MLPEASYLAAFLGGLFSLLSPCSALLLPAFFAYAFESRRELVRKTLVFYLGLCVTLVPLGMGISAVSRLFYGQRSTLILVAGVALILLGAWQLMGRGFSLGPFERLRGRVRGNSVGATFALGAVYGFAGFCSGPILGAVLTVAAASGETVRGAGLLATYALGMAAPLFVLASLWDKLNLGGRRWLRGRELGFGKLRVHTTNLVSGAMFVLLGVLFIAYEGTSALTGFYASRGAEDLALSTEKWADSVARAVPDKLALALFAALAVSFLVYRRFAGKKKGPGSDPGPDAPPRV